MQQGLLDRSQLLNLSPDALTQQTEQEGFRKQIFSVYDHNSQNIQVTSPEVDFVQVRVHKTN